MQCLMDTRMKCCLSTASVAKEEGSVGLGHAADVLYHRTPK